ncbi:MAG: hypothetical protein ABJD53_15890 [Gammaproteobacteria bacterium]
MLLRPANATWFELLTGRDDLAPALRCLAATGQVELESHTDGLAAHQLPALRAAIEEYHRLAQQYAAYWPAAASAPVARRREPEQISNEALAQLHTWVSSADSSIVCLQRLAHEQTEIELIQPLFARARAGLPNLGLFGRSGPLLASHVYLLAPKTGALDIPPVVLVDRIECGEQTYMLAVGPCAQMAALDDELIAVKAQRLVFPESLPADPVAVTALLSVRLEQITGQAAELRSRLSQFDQVHGIAAALADLAFIQWFVNQVPELAGTPHFAWITGWTSDPSGSRFEATLRRAQVHYLLHFPQAPRDIVAPILQRNPRWARPFEVFGGLLGVPAANEADPSMILALLTPLMFGFMFGDVGQGAVLVAAGLGLRRRYPATALLIPGGIAAMAFGVLFGSVFAREDILSALWLRPMQQPLTLLGVSVAGGSAIILLGLVLDAVQHYWVGQARLWWATRAGLGLCYLGLIGSTLDRHALWSIPAGLLWYCIGDGAGAPSRLRRLGVSLGEALETLLQLFVNTLSFVRVGAFALAHAGLAAAVFALAGGIDARPIALLALALGNALLIVIEGLVVGIQTTRLVLFEFFIRFLRGSGRPFRPLHNPPPINIMAHFRKST